MILHQYCFAVLLLSICLTHSHCHGRGCKVYGRSRKTNGVTRRPQINPNAPYFISRRRQMPSSPVRPVQMPPSHVRPVQHIYQQNKFLNEIIKHQQGSLANVRSHILDTIWKLLPRIIRASSLTGTQSLNGLQGANLRNMKGLNKQTVANIKLLSRPATTQPLSQNGQRNQNINVPNVLNVLRQVIPSQTLANQIPQPNQLWTGIIPRVQAARLRSKNLNFLDTVHAFMRGFALPGTNNNMQSANLQMSTRQPNQQSSPTGQNVDPANAANVNVQGNNAQQRANKIPATKSVARNHPNNKNLNLAVSVNANINGNAMKEPSNRRQSPNVPSASQQNSQTSQTVNRGRMANANNQGSNLQGRANRMQATKSIVQSSPEGHNVNLEVSVNTNLHNHALPLSTSTGQSRNLKTAPQQPQQQNILAGQNANRPNAIDIGNQRQNMQGRAGTNPGTKSGQQSGQNNQGPQNGNANMQEPVLSGPSNAMQSTPQQSANQQNNPNVNNPNAANTNALRNNVRGSTPQIGPSQQRQTGQSGGIPVNLGNPISQGNNVVEPANRMQGANNEVAAGQPSARRNNQSAKKRNGVLDINYIFSGRTRQTTPNRLQNSNMAGRSNQQQSQSRSNRRMRNSRTRNVGGNMANTQERPRNRARNQNRAITPNTNSQRQTIQVLMETGWFQEVSETPPLFRQILIASRNPRIARWIQQLAQTNLMEEFIDYVEAFTIITSTELSQIQMEVILRLGSNDLLQDLNENPPVLIMILNYCQNDYHVQLIVSLSENGDIEDLIVNPGLFSRILDNAVTASQAEVVRVLSSTDALQLLIPVPNLLIQILQFSITQANANRVISMAESGDLQQLIDNPSLAANMLRS